MNDGDVRGYLLDLGIRKRLWENATQRTRRTVKQTFALIDTLNSAVQTCLHGNGTAARRAERTLTSVIDTLEGARTGKKGFLSIQRANDRHEKARALAARLLPMLIDAERRDSGRNAVTRRGWAAAEAKRIGRDLTDEAEGACTLEDLLSLDTKSPKVLSREIAGRVFAVPPRELVRKQRRSR